MNERTNFNLRSTLLSNGLLVNMSNRLSFPSHLHCAALSELLLLVQEFSSTARFYGTLFC
jgi:hypothetical protein